MAARLTPEPTVLGALYVIERHAPNEYARAIAICPDGTTLAEARAECRRLDRYAVGDVVHVPARVPVRVPRA